MRAEAGLSSLYTQVQQALSVVPSLERSAPLESGWYPLYMAKALPRYEAEVWEYKDKVVGNMTCNLCGGKFIVQLGAHPDAIKAMSSEFKAQRLFVVSDRLHSCPDDSLPVDDRETDRVVNVYHETKRRLVGRGLVDKFGKPVENKTVRTRGRRIE